LERKHEKIIGDDPNLIMNMQKERDENQETNYFTTLLLLLLNICVAKLMHALSTFS
jgi:hypothetical protein